VGYNFPQKFIYFFCSRDFVGNGHKKLSALSRHLSASRGRLRAYD
jgi:hypothetical protein